MNFRPGDRTRRWKQSHNTSGIIFLFMGGFLMVLSEWHTGTVLLGGILIFLSYLDFRDANRGWKIKTKPPENCYRNAKKDGWVGEHARDYIKRWKSGELDKDGPEYSFSRKK